MSPTKSHILNTMASSELRKNELKKKKKHLTAFNKKHGLGRIF